MKALNRRRFLESLATAGVATALSRISLSAEAPKTKMTLNLMCGMIGVSANQTEAIDLAYRHGFQSVEAYGDYLSSLSGEQMDQLKGEMQKKGVVFGAASLPVDFRGDEARFEEGLKRLPKIAAGLHRAGVERVGTWIMPGDPHLTYLQNFKQHARRLRAIAQILKDHGQRFGLEYVGTMTLRNSRKYPFVHTLAETNELIVEIGTGNVGFVLDTWHWWTAGDTEADILSLTNKDVVAVDLNDAPANLPKEQQVDGRRELPAATGVIDVASFLNALVKIGYDGPVRAEPFNKALNDLDNEAACAATISALKKALSRIP